MILPRQATVTCLKFADGSVSSERRRLAEETPVAFEYNGIGYAVMMASPRNLHDYAVGFTLADGLAETVEEIEDVSVAEIENGAIVRVTLARERAERLHERVRLRLVEGSCGLCGLESIEEVFRPLPRLTTVPQIGFEALSAALSALGDHQPVGRATGAMHAAAFCAPDGCLLAVREDIGRHNALDKLIGHLLRGQTDPASGFVLLSARCSYELVEKTVRAGIPALATISAPSDLAVTRARDAGLTLIALARSDTALVLNDPHAVFGR
jgi:FdhD protein